MELYVTRERDNELWLHFCKPIYHPYGGYFSSDRRTILLPNGILPEVTFENSPQRIDVKIV